MMRIVLSICFITFSLVGIANPRVPSSYTFADIKLNITEAARREIQADVDALHKSQTYLQRKVNKADLYFPIIERVFSEENLPDDFKYLCIQESALIPDAVSSSNAVGFWQFKKASGEEVGLRIDKYIDERMHITASSHAAAKYLKKNNFFFDNWLYALLAYNTGPGGAEKYVDKKNLGKKKMEISKRTHWYVKKFLAHKIAFENEIHKNYAPSIKIYEYEKTANKSLKEISDFFEIDDQTIADYNVWLRKGRIPTDKTYFAIIPVTTNDYVAQNLLGVGENVKAVDPPKSKIVFVNDYKPISEFNFNENEEFPKVNNNSPTKVKINGIPGFIAKSTDDINSISVGHGISINKFLKNNDMTASDKIIPGRVYYLKTKKSKAKIHYHVVIPGENAWSISQKYGLRVRKLLTKNRMKEEKDLGSGMVMWLRFIRPSDVPVEYKESVAQNVIVKSIPNEIEYPQSNYTPIEQGSSNENLSSEALVLENEREDFLFEEISDDTEFISEKSYVDLKEEEKNIEKQTTDNLSQKEIKNVKKVEFYHIVKSGETLFSISRTYEISIGELRQWNNFDNLDVLSVGQQLLIKSHSKPMIETQSSKSSNNYKSYKVKADDTLYGIARKYNISIKELMEINNKDDFNIKEGEVIKIKL